jgi:hypothetical protein
MAGGRLCAGGRVWQGAGSCFTRVVAVANDLGLLAEEYDTVACRQTGNFPQALTHIALINTAHNLCAAKTPTEKRRCSGPNSRPDFPVAIRCDAVIQIVRQVSASKHRLISDS